MFRINPSWLVAVALCAAVVVVATPVKLSVPVDGLTVPNVCATPPDLVVLSGAMDVTVDTKLETGGLVSGKVSYNAGGIKGQGLNGQYTGNGTGNLTFKVGGP